MRETGIENYQISGSQPEWGMFPSLSQGQAWGKMLSIFARAESEVYPGKRCRGQWAAPVGLEFKGAA